MAATVVTITQGGINSVEEKVLLPGQRSSSTSRQAARILMPLIQPRLRGCWSLICRSWKASSSRARLSGPTSTGLRPPEDASSATSFRAGELRASLLQPPTAAVSKAIAASATSIRHRRELEGSAPR